MQTETAFTIRPASMADVDALVANILAMAMESESRQLDPDTLRGGIETILKEPMLGTYWVVEAENGDLAGNTLMTLEWSDWNNAAYWWLQSLYVHPDYRGQGAFEQLVAAVETAAKSSQVRELRLYVDESNSRAIRVYERNGFESGHYRVMTKSL